MVTFLAAATLTGQQRLNMFTECECNMTLLKQELNYVNHTVDPTTAQVNLFIVTNYLSNGGRVYNVDFKGQEELAGNNLQFKVSTTTVMTSFERDQLLTHRIKLGLVGFLAGTDFADRANVVIPEPEAVEQLPNGGSDSVTDIDGPNRDSWNNWIFEVSSTFRSTSESRRSRTSLGFGFDADRTTPEMRIRASPNYFYSTEAVTQSDGTTLNSIRQDAWLNGSVVRSIGDHWSVGVFGSTNTSTFRNVDLGAWIAPAIEYNIFNYDEVPFKEFTVAYRVGWQQNYYTEQTVFFKTEEDFLRHVLDVNLRIRQRWGSVNAGISGRNILSDFSKNRLSLNGRGNIRLFRGLSFTFRGRYDIINDQISLKLEDASVEDILLGQQQLATSFEADFRFGLSYTFGSLFNNVVNTRL